jgi:hypothetical protein|tara:strand:- start:47 stop:373 length:327 start_codon:yes stop_codon:yes gene_type:complete
VENKMKNKKADISITILVLGVVAISILTIFSFVGVNNERKNNFLGIGLIETIGSIGEEIKFYDKTEFESRDYENNVFERRGVKIIMDENKVTEGTYTKNGKILVKVIY